MTQKLIFDENYLMHYGVKGMKWGVRHDPERSGQRARAKAAKGKLKAARKQYNKDFNSAYYYSQRHPISTQFKNTKTRKELERRSDIAVKSAKRVQAAKKNYRKEAGVAADRRDTAVQVGKVLASTAIAAGALYIAANPAAAASVSKAMKTGLGSIAKNAKRGANYMKNARYNKASQLMSPGAASKAEFKRSSYKAMNRATKKAGRAYNEAAPRFSDANKTTAKDILNSVRKTNAAKSVKNAAESAGTAANNAAGKANKAVDSGVSRARASAKNAPGNVKRAARNVGDSAYISGRNAYADARTAATRAARRTTTDAKIVKEMTKDSAGRARDSAYISGRNAYADARTSAQKFASHRKSDYNRAKKKVKKTMGSSTAAKVGIGAGAGAGLAGEGAIVYKARKRKKNR